jgi:hypothetical protein
MELDAKKSQASLDHQVSHRFSVAVGVLITLEIPHSALHVWTELWEVQNLSLNYTYKNSHNEQYLLPYQQETAVW